jgi:hypothetical protein
MKPIYLASLAGALLTLAALRLPAQLHGTYTIGGASPDFATLDDAVAQLNLQGLSSDAVFKIRTGTHTCHAIVGDYAGNELHTATFTSESGNAADVLLENTWDYALMLSSSQHVTLQNLSFRAHWREVIIEASKHITVRGCRFLASPYTGYTTGIFSSDNTDLLIEGSQFMSMTGCVIYFGRGVVCKGNSFVGIQSAISLYACRGAEVMENTIQQFSLIGISLGYDSLAFVHHNHIVSAVNTNFLQGIVTEDQLGLVRVAQNRIELSGGRNLYGIRHLGGNDPGLPNLQSHLSVENNFISLTATNQAIGLYINDEDENDLPTHRRLDLVHNTVNLTGTTTVYNIPLLVQMAHYYSTPWSEINIHNNLFANNTSTPTWPYHNSAAFLYDTPANPGGLLRLDHNNYHKASATSALIYTQAGPKNTLADWQAFGGKDLHSLTLVPAFVSATDLHLTDTAFAHGSPWAGITTDIDGETRSTVTPWIGADEVPAPNHSCGPDGSKVLVCHLPPGKPDKPVTICVAASAVPAHLAHGCTVGPCPSARMASDEMAISEVLIHPNPVADVATIRFDGFHEGAAIVEVLSLEGQLLQRFEVPQGTEELTLPLGHLPSGLYLLRVRQDGLETVAKFSKL